MLLKRMGRRIQIDTIALELCVQKGPEHRLFENPASRRIFNRTRGHLEAARRLIAEIERRLARRGAP